MINTRRLLHLFKHLRAVTSTLPCHFVHYLVSRACIIFFLPFFCRSIFLVNKQPNRFSLRIILLYGHSAPSIKIFLLKVDRAKCLPGDIFTSTARAMALGNGEARLGAKDDRRVAENIREETCQGGWILLGGAPGSIDKFASGQKACLICIPRSVHRPCKAEPRFACAWRTSCVSSPFRRVHVKYSALLRSIPETQTSFLTSLLPLFRYDFPSRSCCRSIIWRGISYRRLYDPCAVPLTVNQSTINNK